MVIKANFGQDACKLNHSNLSNKFSIIKPPFEYLP